MQLLGINIKFFCSFIVQQLYHYQLNIQSNIIFSSFKPGSYSVRIISSVSVTVHFISPYPSIVPQNPNMQVLPAECLRQQKPCTIYHLPFLRLTAYLRGFASRNHIYEGEFIYVHVHILFPYLVHSVPPSHVRHGNIKDTLHVNSVFHCSPTYMHMQLHFYDDACGVKCCIAAS